MRPGFAGLILAISVAALRPAGGAAPAAEAAPAPPLTVVTAFYPLYVATLNVADDAPGVRVVNLAPAAAGCAEHYQLTPGDMRTLAAADVLVVHGAGLENYIEKVAALFPKLKIVDASAGLPIIEVKHEPNPHLWVSPVLAARQAINISKGLAAADTDAGRRELYRKNAAAYAARLDALAARMAAALARAPSRKVVVFHDGLPYLARDLNLEIVAAVEPALGQQPGARRLADIVAQVRAAGAPVALIVEKGSPNPAALALRQELNAPLYPFDLATDGPLEPPAAVRDAYVRAMERNTETLRAALKAPPES